MKDLDEQLRYKDAMLKSSEEDNSVMRRLIEDHKKSINILRSKVNKKGNEDEQLKLTNYEMKQELYHLKNYMNSLKNDCLCKHIL